MFESKDNILFFNILLKQKILNMFLVSTVRVYGSGNDRITLSRGTNYFICGIPGHCVAGMKMAVTAA
jgi:hypothetical protein